jgi:HEAT repeat protein
LLIFKPNIDKLKSQGNIKKLVKVIKAIENYDEKIYWQETMDALFELNKEKEAVPVLIKKIKDPLVKLFFKELAIESLGKIQDEGSISSLFEFMEDFQLEPKALNAISKFNNSCVIEPLIDLVIKRIESGNDYTKLISELDRRNLFWARSTSARKKVPKLLKILEEGQETSKLKVITLLEKISDERSIKPLIKAMEDEELAFNASRALGDCEEPRIHELLVDTWLKQIERGKYKSDITTELDRRYPDWFFSDSARKAIPILRKKLIEENEENIKDVIILLAKFQDRQSINPIIEVIKTRYVDWHPGTVKQLGQLKDSRIIEAVLESLIAELIESTNIPLIKTLTSRLDEIDRNWTNLDIIKKIAPELIQNLENNDPEIRKRAAFLLGRLKNKTAFKSLLVACIDENRDVRKEAKSALETIDKDWMKSESAKNAVPMMISALTSGDKAIREQAAMILGEINDNRSVNPLKAALKDENHTVRDEAVKALGNSKDKGLIEDLIIMFLDPASISHYNLEFALKNIDVNWTKSEATLKAVPTMISALKNTNSNVRVGAALALGLINDTRTISPLISALDDENWRVQEVAALAMKEKGVSASEKALDDWIKKLINNLVLIYQKYPEGFVKGKGGKPENELWLIGSILNKLGGLNLMKKAHAEFSLRSDVPGSSRNLEFIWDKIGDWQG